MVANGHPLIIVAGEERLLILDIALIFVSDQLLSQLVN